MARVHRWMEEGGDGLRDPFLLGVRLLWGGQFALTGFGKLTHLADATAYFASLGIPAPAQQAVLAGATELAGGTLLMAGLASRFAALPLAITMIVALGTAHRGAVLGFASDPEAALTALPATFLLAALTVLFVGAGRWSVDYWLSSTERALPVRARGEVRS